MCVIVFMIDLCHCLLLTEELVLPTTSSFFAYVCAVKSPTKIAIRIIDDGYSVGALCTYMLSFIYFCDICVTATVCRQSCLPCNKFGRIDASRYR